MSRARDLNRESVEAIRCGDTESARERGLALSLAELARA